MDESERRACRRRLADLFSGYRAEWLNERVFELFSEPSYFPQLTTSHPCFLEGGRGTGKTTVLRCLSYQGQAALHGGTSSSGCPWPFVGLYYRINTNRVRAFAGPELESTTWVRMFAHYLNLEFSELIVGFLEWYGQQNPDEPTVEPKALRLVAAALRLDPPANLESLGEALQFAKVSFEAAINNVADSERLPFLSVQGGPIDTLMREVKKLPQFAALPFFFLVDEYENLDEYQQRVTNTLIKHCGELYSFKVGVRELGFRERSTLNALERLVAPADYRLINISDELQERFTEFARDVCEQRLRQVLGEGATVPKLEALLPELSAEKEAEELGVRRAIKATERAVREDVDGSTGAEAWLGQAHPLEVFVLGCRAKAENVAVGEKLQQAMDEPGKWNEHYENFKHAYLFAIRKGKRGIRKYFSGWRVYCLLSGRNIRYLLELVDHALSKHMDGGQSPESAVDARIQTKVAQVIGQRNLQELEGVSLQGARLTKLLLGLGRVFQVMAEDPIGHTPEVTQFCLDADVGGGTRTEKLDGLITEGIMHLALLRYPGSKLQGATEVRQVDYAIHPIFAAFFGFSYRRKRKIELRGQDVLELAERTSSAVGAILARQNRVVDVALPEQMALFGEFYGAE